MSSKIELPVRFWCLIGLAAELTIFVRGSRPAGFLFWGEKEEEKNEISFKRFSYFVNDGYGIMQFCQ